MTSTDTKMKTKILPHGHVESRPTEIYGTGDVILRIGNGGAGAVGLIEALAIDYLNTVPIKPSSVTWICNHSRNTQLALLYGHIDLALTYERDQEEIAELEGWSKSSGCIFHDHFCLIGPVSDPSKVKSTDSILEALAKIYETGGKFHSRADGSATMSKERSLWSKIGHEPWVDKSAAEWYHTNSFGPAQALIEADAAGAYLLIDRATLLRQTALQTIYQSTVYFEPESPVDPLMNSCFALYASNLSGPNLKVVAGFLEYVLSDRGQKLIGSLGQDEVGIPLFASVRDDMSKTSLIGGRPFKGRWIFDS